MKPGYTIFVRLQPNRTEDPKVELKGSRNSRAVTDALESVFAGGVDTFSFAAAGGDGGGDGGPTPRPLSEASRVPRSPSPVAGCAGVRSSVAVLCGTITFS